MIRLIFAIELGYEIAGQPADFVLNIHAARTPRQAVISEVLATTPPVEFLLHVDPAQGDRYLRLRSVPGPFTLRYEAIVDIVPHLESPELLPEVPIARIAPEVLACIYPSRDCQSDRLRDFAHLMIALCRALNIPARFVTSIDYGAAAELGPPDFHAYVEVFLGERWYSFDPTGIAAPMGLVRIGTGRDAADVSFATIFGSVKSRIPLISIAAVDDPANGYDLPLHCTQALSTTGDSAIPSSAPRPCAAIDHALGNGL